jgi:hypothetical protein
MAAMHNEDDFLSEEWMVANSLTSFIEVANTESNEITDGDYVRIVNCVESALYKDSTFIVNGDPFMYRGMEVVRLQDLEFAMPTDCLIVLDKRQYRVGAIFIEG